MLYLGQFIPKKSYFMSGGWHDIPDRVVCTAETIEEQMYCSLYEPSARDEQAEKCHTAPTFSCRFCESGCSDICSAKRESK